MTKSKNTNRAQTRLVLGALGGPELANVELELLSLEDVAVREEHQ